MNIKKLVSAVLAVSVLSTSSFFGAYAVSADLYEDITTINGIEYVETFCDEFEGNKLDTSKWEFCPEWDRQGASHWNRHNTSLDGNGNLLLKASYKSGSDLLQCGAVRTRGKFEQAYGYYEMRCKLQTKDGFWSAFWMMPRDNSDRIIGGGDGTEIDIFEAVNVNKPTSTGKGVTLQHALHWDGYESNHGTTHQIATTESDVYDGEYHTFAMDWSKESYKFYIDGVLSAEIDADEIPGGTSAVKQYMKISLESSDGWSGRALKSEMPDYFTVDYVKVYQRVEYLAEQTVYGDANGDGDVNLLDLLLMRKYLANWNVTIDRFAADCNANGDVNLLDLILMRKYLAKWNVDLGPQK